MSRWWSKGIRYSLWLVALTVGILAVWEWIRRSNIVWMTSAALLGSAEPHGAQPPEIDPASLEKEFQNPQRLSALVEEVRDSFRTISRREVELDHTVRTTVTEINPKLAQPPAEQTLERVTFRGGKKYRQTIEWLDLVSGKPKKGTNKKVREDVNKIQELFPFHSDPANEGYQYSFAGIEQIAGQWTVKIHFEPSESPVRRFRGEAWIDPTHRRPCRVFCQMAEKKPFLDQFSMLLEYAQVQTGDWQLVHSIIDGSGGFAMIQKHYRSEVDLFDYAPSENPPLKTSRTSPTP